MRDEGDGASGYATPTVTLSTAFNMGRSFTSLPFDFIDFSVTTSFQTGDVIVCSPAASDAFLNTQESISLELGSSQIDNVAPQVRRYFAIKTTPWSSSPSNSELATIGFSNGRTGMNNDTSSTDPESTVSSAAPASLQPSAARSARRSPAAERLCALRAHPSRGRTWRSRRRNLLLMTSVEGVKEIRVRQVCQQEVWTNDGQMIVYSHPNLTFSATRDSR